MLIDRKASLPVTGSPPSDLDPTYMYVITLLRSRPHLYTAIIGQLDAPLKSGVIVHHDELVCESGMDHRRIVLAWALSRSGQFNHVDLHVHFR